MIDFYMIAGLGIFIVALTFFIVTVSGRGIDMLANPTINRYVFFSAKLSALITCAFIPVAGLYPQIKWWQTPASLNGVALLFCIAGVGIATLAMQQLGDDLVAGLPDIGIHQLQTEGVYRISRNPLYLGVFLLVIASMIYAPHPLNILSGLTAIAIHHVIVLREEKYLIR
jgi:protein-S-isoprenylcysteine O-methyltransferase Ste14